MNEVKKCFKCGIEEGQLQEVQRGLLPVFLIVHHIKYNPEVTVDCCKSCHKKIHSKVRREKLCKLSIPETARLSNKCNHKRTYQQVIFAETIAPNIRFYEGVAYRKSTGSITCFAYFFASNNKELYNLC